MTTETATGLPPERAYEGAYLYETAYGLLDDAVDNARGFGYGGAHEDYVHSSAELDYVSGELWCRAWSEDRWDIVLLGWRYHRKCMSARRGIWRDFAKGARA